MNYCFQAARSKIERTLKKGHLKMGETNLKGNSIIPNSRYIEKDGHPWLPVMGEIHFSRYPAELWEEEILKMKACGIDIIASYVFWIHHEEEEGYFDWNGNKNLRKFVELCGKHGLYFFVRIGPWCHGECRNGGFPDWLLKKGCKLRTNDPEYLSYVRIWYEQIARQLKGLYFKDGGPIIGVQIENELHGNPWHLLTLKNIAREMGMIAPLYTVTGWGGGRGVNFPEEEVIPAFGGYPEAPWEQHVNELNPNTGYFFHPFRNDNGIGNDLFGSDPDNAADHPNIENYPYITCEIGGGIQNTYHRRPRLSPHDVAVIPMTKLACGANMLGYYMFHGGSNPIGRLSTMQESRETKYPNDYPVIAYDFQGALGQYGQVRPHYHILRCLHLFLKDFGSRMAPMATVLPDILPKDRYDTETARMAVRVGENGEGFIFFNNHQRYPGIDDIMDVQAQIHLDDETILIPRTPFTLKKNSYFFWPFNFRMEEITLKQATVQPLCFINSGNETVYFFIACDGAEPEYIFEGDVSITDPAGARVLKENGNTVVMNVRQGIEAPIRICTGKGDILVVTLTRRQAEQSWKGSIDGRDIFVMCEGNDLYFKENELVIYGSNTDVELTIYPSLSGGLTLSGSGLNGLYESGRQLEKEKVAIFEKYRLKISGKNVKVCVQPDDTPLPDTYNRFLFVSDGDMDSVRQWKVTLPGDALDGVYDIMLRVNLVGDVIQAYMGEEMVNDDYYFGAPFEMALNRFGDKWKEGIVLRVSPLRRDMGIYLQEWPKFTRGKMAEITDVEAVSIYQVRVRVG